jgi:hypothetical protein
MFFYIVTDVVSLCNIWCYVLTLSDNNLWNRIVQMPSQVQDAATCTPRRLAEQDAICRWQSETVRSKSEEQTLAWNNHDQTTCYASTHAWHPRNACRPSPRSHVPNKKVDEFSTSPCRWRQLKRDRQTGRRTLCPIKLPGRASSLHRRRPSPSISLHNASEHYLMYRASNVEIIHLENELTGVFI